MERWFVENLRRNSGLPFELDLCETLKDIKYHYFDDKNYSLTLRELLMSKRNSYGRIVVKFVADILVGPVKFGYGEIAFYVYVCRALGIPPIHVTYMCDEKVCIEKIAATRPLNSRAYSIDAATHTMIENYSSAFEFVKRELVHRIPVDTDVICSTNDETFRIYKSKTEDHCNVRAFVEWAGETTGNLRERPTVEVEKFNNLIDPYQSCYEVSSVKSAIYDACVRQKSVGTFETAGPVYFEDFNATSEILNTIAEVGGYKSTIGRESTRVGSIRGTDARRYIDNDFYRPYRRSTLSLTNSRPYRRATLSLTNSCPPCPAIK